MSIYVDLDNLYIINNKVSPTTLLLRVKALLKLFGARVHFYGNSFTQGLLQKRGVYDTLNFHVSDIETNSADHNLIHMITRSKSKRIVVVSSDMTLCRLAKYLHPLKSFMFLKFTDDNMLVKMTVDFQFQHKHQLDKFMTSLDLYHTRYPANKKIAFYSKDR